MTDLRTRPSRPPAQGPEATGTPAERPRADVGRWLRTALIAAGGVVMLFPFAWMVSTSLTTDAELFAIPPRLVPRPVDGSSYERVLTDFPLARWLANSVAVAILSTFLQVLTGAMAAYAFARLRFRGREVLFAVYLATLMIPLQVLVVPLFIQMEAMGLVNTFPALVLPLIASPFTVFLLRQAFLSLPRDLEEAAFVDGAGHWRVFTRVVLPLSKPALATATVFAFMAAWNSFLWPLVVISSESLMTLPLGLATLQGRFTTAWNLVLAGSTISVLPIVALYLVAQRYIIQGVALSGLKR